ncbi:MAG TPA: HAD family hydrolase [Acidimicrobiales bacterium]|nr:HAD family hydrolase [Acidimicrobiales bacterium]
MTRAIEAVTFDYWNTLVYEDRGQLRGHRLDAWAGILEEAGFAVERQHIGAVFDASWERFTAAWTANQQLLAAEAAESLVEELGFEVPVEVRAALVEAFGRVGEQAELHITEGIGECLRGLKESGVRIGIICDVGFTGSVILRSHLERNGLLSFFDHWSFSDEVGVYKPDPAIFRHALEGLGGVAPDRAAHVGDLRRTDIAGALAMGMTAVRYVGVNDDDSQPDPEGHHVVDHHGKLAGVLGL